MMIHAWYSMEGCATIVLLYIYTESVENVEEREEVKKGRKREKLDLK